MKFPGADVAADRLAAELHGLLANDPSGSVPSSRVIAVGEDGLPLARLLAERIGAEVESPRVEYLRLPWYQRLALGALTADNHHFIDPIITADHVLGAREIAQLCRERLPTLREPGWRKPKPLGPVTAIVVARSLSTGYRALALGASARSRGASQVILAAACGARDAVERIGSQARPLVLSVSDEPRFDPDACFPPPP